MKTSTQSVTTLAIYDRHIKYLNLAKNSQGMYVEHYDTFSLEEGIIVRGEILKPDALEKVLKKITQNTENKKVHLLLPHEYFLFDTHTLKNSKNKKTTRVLKKYLKEKKYEITWAATHDYEYDILNRTHSFDVLFRALPRDIHSSYQYVFKKTGLKILSIHSDLLSHQSCMPLADKNNHIIVGANYSYIIHYKNGLYTHAQKFEFSYAQCLKDIKKNVSVSDEKAQDILNKYGVLQAHPDKDVFKKLSRSLSPLLDFLKKQHIATKKIKKEQRYYLQFSGLPIKGLSDKIMKHIQTELSELSILETTKYTFQDVLSLHKRDSYVYAALIARSADILSSK